MGIYLNFSVSQLQVSQHFFSLLRRLNYAEEVSNSQLETDSQVRRFGE